MSRLLLILLLAFSGIGSAEVTAAWKVPIESRIPDHENDEKVRKLDKPPDESAFFEAGDELWEVSEAFAWQVAAEAREMVDPFAEPSAEPIKVDWKGEWIVWNARSRMFVARGTWSQIMFAQDVLGFEDQPIVLRSRFDIEGGQDGGESNPGSNRSISLVSRSAEKARAALDGFEVEVEATAFGSIGISEAVYQLSWPAGGEGHRWEVKAAVTAREELRTRLARQGTGPDSWEAWLTVSRELLDGTPIGQGRLIETAEGIEPWKFLEPGRKEFRKLLGPNRELGIFPAPEDLLSKLTGAEVVINLPDMEAPPEFVEWVRGLFIDIAKPLLELGVKVDSGSGHFAGFDPRRKSLVIVAEPVKLDIVEQIFLNLNDHPPLNLWIETNSDSGAWGLASRSGERAWISRRVGDVTDLLFEIEPTLGGNEKIMDLRYKFDVVTGDQALGKIESATTLHTGKAARVATYSREGMKDLEVVLTGTVTGE
jgi:hypothetical protein